MADYIIFAVNLKMANVLKINKFSDNISGYMVVVMVQKGNEPINYQ